VTRVNKKKSSASKPGFCMQAQNHDSSNAQHETCSTGQPVMYITVT